ncbi:hypothetical protein CDV31_016233 [Fusarium ambrosium]|uniref:Amidohydrolase-related domain-containing protein n=1 Tax=Fusarium ambrosium TaxID=131363 RepID=A0A428SCP4_9HYPO|nr:hypothetical protein CDV31_016233 [Fusarium ambrosium]
MLYSFLLHYFITAGSAANVLFRGGTVISFDEDSQSVQVLRNNSLLIEGNKIAAIFPSDSDFEVPKDAEIIPSEGKIISPGFIDTHRHLWQTAYRTISSNITLATYSAYKGPFVKNVIDRFSADDIYYGQYFAIRESLNAGVTSTVDHAHASFTEETADASLRASIDAGARTYWCFQAHSPLNNYSLHDQWDSIRKWAQTIDWNATPVKLGLSFDEFATVDQGVIDDIARTIRDNNISLLSTHYLGGPWIAPNSPSLLYEQGLLNTTVPVIFAHGTFITPDDHALLREYNHYVAIAPESEMHFGHTYPFAHKIMDQASLAVDAHFTYSADIVTQARIWLQSVRLLLFGRGVSDWKIPSNNPMSVNQAFLLATRSGAQALRRPDLGVLKAGAVADVVVFEGNAPNLLGWRDPVAAIILHSNPGNVEHVLVDGQFRKRNFTLVNPRNASRQLDDAAERFLESAVRIQDEFLADGEPRLEGEFRESVDYVWLEEVDAVRGNSTGY